MVGRRREKRTAGKLLRKDFPRNELRSARKTRQKFKRGN